MINTPSYTQKCNKQQGSKNNYYGKLNNKYILIEKIGKGATSSVYSAFIINDDCTTSLSNYHNDKNKYQNKFFAVKICKKNWNQKSFLEEGKIMKIISKSDFHIIAFYETGKGPLTKTLKKTTKIVIYHVMELAENFELFDYVKAPMRGFGEKFGRIIFTQILSAVSTCHENGIIHKDIKTENILLSFDYQCKLADFGLSVEKKNKLPLFSISGTDGYFPPEVFMNKGYDLVQCDIFALGVVLFIIVMGVKPFNTTKRRDVLYRKIWKGNFEQYWGEFQMKGEVSENFKMLVQKIFAVNPEERLTLEEIRKSKWMTGVEITNDDRIGLRKEFQNRRECVEEYRKVRNGKDKGKRRKLDDKEINLIQWKDK